MISTILGAFRVGEIRKKILFTAGILALYRLGTHIPAPGIKASSVRRSSRLAATASSACSTCSRAAAWAGSRSSRSGSCPTSRPRSSSSCCRWSSLAGEAAKEGEVGQARITQYTRYLTVGLAFAQSIGYVFLFKSFKQAGVR